MVRISRNETGKAKTHLEFNLVKDVTDNKKGLFKCINNKMKINYNFIKAGGAEKEELLNTLHQSSLTRPALRHL